jgi:hypothetical protein
MEIVENMDFHFCLVEREKSARKRGKMEDKLHYIVAIKL